VANARKTAQNLAPVGAGHGRGCLTETRKQAARAGTTPKIGATTIAYFVKPARTPPRNRAESPKTIPKTVRKTVKTSNNGPHFRTVITYSSLFYAIGQGACQLGTTLAAVRVLCENGAVAAATIPGGQWRVPAAEGECPKREGPGRRGCQQMSGNVAKLKPKQEEAIIARLSKRTGGRRRPCRQNHIQNVVAMAERAGFRLLDVGTGGHSRGPPGPAVDHHAARVPGLGTLLRPSHGRWTFVAHQR